jgi:hypothetical protein
MISPMVKRSTGIKLFKSIFHAPILKEGALSYMLVGVGKRIGSILELLPSEVGADADVVRT